MDYNRSVALDTKFTFLSTIGCKAIIKHGDKILFTREPRDHTWMPGRWGLPGGKILLNESLTELVARKIKDETGLKCEIKGLLKVIDILMPERNVYFFVFVADYKSGRLDMKGKYSDGLAWKSKEEVFKLTKEDLAEYYYEEVFKDVYNNVPLVPISFIQVQPTFRDKKIQEWMSRGTIRE